MTTPAHAKLKKLWDVHQERVLPKIIDYSGASTEELRADLDAYDSHVAGLVVSVLEDATDHIQADWLRDTDESLDPRISAVIASVEDIKEVHEVALEYKKFKHHIDEMFDIVRSILSHKL